MLVSLIFMIRIFLMILFSSLSLHCGLKLNTKNPLFPVCSILGLTSTQFSLELNPQSYEMSTISCWHLNITLVYRLFLLFMAQILITRWPSSSTSSFWHVTEGILVFWERFISILSSIGVFTPTSKLQIPFWAALNLNSSKYYDADYRLIPKTYSGKSQKALFSQVIAMVISFGSFCASFRIIESFFEQILCTRHSPKSKLSTLVASSYRMWYLGLRMMGFGFYLGLGKGLFCQTLISRNAQFIRYQEILKYIDLLIQARQIKYLRMKYQGRYDPLQFLRSYTMNNKEIKYQKGFLTFQKDIKFPPELLTAWISPKSNKQYTIGSLWLFLKHKDDGVTKYMSQLSIYDLEGILVSDREEIKDYFTGKTNTTECINEQMRLQLNTKNLLAESRPVAKFKEVDPIGNKIKGQIDPLQVIEYISRFERPISSKTRSLRCSHKSFENLLKIVEEISNTTADKSQDDKKMRINKIIQRKRNPIIIVPENGVGGNLCLGNIQRFLVKGEYSETFQTSNIHQRKLQFFYELKGKKIAFQVTNNPALIPAADWDNVVAIFVQGRKGEFAGWPVSDPSELFKRYRGFLMRYSGKEHNEGANWNVKIFTLDKNNRFRDEEIKNSIWSDVQRFLCEKV